MSLITLGWSFKKGKKSISDNEQIVDKKEFIELKSQLSQAQTKRDEWAGKNKQLFVQNASLNAGLESVRGEKAKLQTSVDKYELTEEQDRKDTKENIEKLNSAEKSLDNEKERIGREDEARKAKEKEMRTKMWGDHENKVISALIEGCKAKHTTYYTKDTLPEIFDKKFKPDFVVEFSDEYVVLDAKTSLAGSLQTYMKTTVKDTAKKANESPAKIFKTIFFIVPAPAISDLPEIEFYEGGYTFFVVTPESIDPILHMLKKLSEYEFMEEMNPQERDNIINVIASLGHHIAIRNASDLLLTKSGLNTLKKLGNLNPELLSAVNTARGKSRIESLLPSEVKKLVTNDGAPQAEINAIIAPEPIVIQEDFDPIEYLSPSEEKSDEEPAQPLE